ncbi:MAG: hypothetical protein ACRDTM_02365 [Micromonosporaceae bacterium]
MNLDQLDAEKRRRRLQLLAELAEASATRDTIPRPRRARASQLRGLIANRRRLTTSV